ncbi:hypothetical protein ACHAXT_005386 [Thalassiosira profunda]
MSTCKVSTLLFKFDGFADISDDRLKATQISDATTEEGAWKDCPNDLDLFQSPLAIDHHGNEWGLRIVIDYFYNSHSDGNGNRRNPHVDDYQISLCPKTVRKVTSAISSAAWQRQSRADDTLGGSDIVRALGYAVSSNVTISVKDGSGSVFAEWDDTITDGSFDKITSFVKFSEVLDVENNILQDGSLIVEMTVQDFIEASEFSIPRIPEVKQMAKLLESGEHADVEFKVGDSSFPAHKLILNMHAPVLASFFENSGGTPVEIKNVQPEVFCCALKHIYGCGDPDCDFLLEHSDEIIDFADRHALIELKLVAEAEKVASLTVDTSNVVEQLLFANQKNCALLKEYAARVLIERYDEVVVTDSFANLEDPKLLKELLLVVRPLREEAPTDREENLKWQYSKRSVNYLLRQLVRKGLNADGTKDILASRLAEAVVASHTKKLGA